MTPRQKDIDLGSIWLFSALSASQIRTLRRTVDEVDGAASVKRNGRKAATLGPGGYFGELSLLDRRPRSATVVSETEMTLLVLEQRRFNGLLEAMPALAHKLLVAMSERLREADTRAFN
jgi:CRP-like cAMP-binding protein